MLLLIEYNKLVAINSSWLPGYKNRTHDLIMRLKRILLLAVGILLLPMIVMISSVEAQNKSKNRVIIKSDPPGAMIYFKGENSFVGVTPFKLKPNLIGNYRITATKSGFEKSKLEYVFKGTERGVLRLRLIPKTRFKAGIRSLVFPGWGQIYSERKKSGIFLSLLQAGAGLFALMAHLDYDKAFDDYQSALDDYLTNNQNYEVAIQKWQIVESRYRRAEKAFNKRKNWLAISGGLWLYNFLDSIFFFPSFDKKFFHRSLPGISVNIRHDSVGLGLTVPF